MVSDVRATFDSLTNDPGLIAKGVRKVARPRSARTGTRPFPAPAARLYRAELSDMRPTASGDSRTSGCVFKVRVECYRPRRSRRAAANQHQVDYEAEFAVVIGRYAKTFRRTRAEYVARLHLRQRRQARDFQFGEGQCNAVNRATRLRRWDRRS